MNKYEQKGKKNIMSYSRAVGIVHSFKFSHYEIYNSSLNLCKQKERHEKTNAVNSVS